MPEVDSRPGEQPHGFEVKSVTPIDELRAMKTELAHQHSGARLLHVYNESTK